MAYCHAQAVIVPNATSASEARSSYMLAIADSPDEYGYGISGDSVLAGAGLLPLPRHEFNLNIGKNSSQDVDRNYTRRDVEEALSYDYAPRAIPVHDDSFHRAFRFVERNFFSFVGWASSSVFKLAILGVLIFTCIQNAKNAHLLRALGDTDKVPQ